jgi:hypothetical protein
VFLWLTRGRTSLRTSKGFRSTRDALSEVLSRLRGVKFTDQQVVSLYPRRPSLRFSLCAREARVKFTDKQVVLLVREKPISEVLSCIRAAYTRTSLRTSKWFCSYPRRQLIHNCTSSVTLSFWFVFNSVGCSNCNRFGREEARWTTIICDEATCQPFRACQ